MLLQAKGQGYFCISPPPPLVVPMPLQIYSRSLGDPSEACGRWHCGMQGRGRTSENRLLTSTQENITFVEQ